MMRSQGQSKKISPGTLKEIILDWAQPLPLTGFPLKSCCMLQANAWGCLPARNGSPVLAEL